MHRVVLFDDDAHKASPGEERNMVRVPMWDDTDDSCTLLAALVDAVLELNLPECPFVVGSAGIHACHINCVRQLPGDGFTCCTWAYVRLQSWDGRALEYCPCCLHTKTQYAAPHLHAGICDCNIDLVTSTTWRAWPSGALTRLTRRARHLHVLACAAAGLTCRGALLSWVALSWDGRMPFSAAHIDCMARFNVPTCCFPWARGYTRLQQRLSVSTTWRAWPASARTRLTCSHMHNAPTAHTSAYLGLWTNMLTYVTTHLLSLTGWASISNSERQHHQLLTNIIDDLKTVLIESVPAAGNPLYHDVVVKRIEPCLDVGACVQIMQGYVSVLHIYGRFLYSNMSESRYCVMVYIIMTRLVNYGGTGLIAYSNIAVLNGLLEKIRDAVAEWEVCYVVAETVPVAYHAC
eukprot:366212-Chlamydomonas_euryale.AAC.26